MKGEGHNYRDTIYVFNKWLYMSLLFRCYSSRHSDKHSAITSSVIINVFSSFIFVPPTISYRNGATYKYILLRKFLVQSRNKLKIREYIKR